MLPTLTFLLLPFFMRGGRPQSRQVICPRSYSKSKSQNSTEVRLPPPLALRGMGEGVRGEARVDWRPPGRLPEAEGAELSPEGQSGEACRREEQPAACCSQLSPGLLGLGLSWRGSFLSRCSRTSPRAEWCCQLELCWRLPPGKGGGQGQQDSWEHLLGVHPR